MATPTPAIPSFTDGTVVHQADLNALASNLTNLYNYNQGGFFTQRPCVLAKATSGQSVANATHVLVNMQAEVIDTDNMWTASVANEIKVQHAGIYWIFGQVRWPSSAANILQANLLVNGTAVPTNVVTTSNQSAVNSAGGHHVAYMANLAVNATIYLDCFQNSGGTVTLDTLVNGSSFGAVFLTPSS
jgi:ribosomal protein S6